MPQILFIDFGAFVALLLSILSWFGPSGDVAKQPLAVGDEPTVVAAMQDDLATRLHVSVGAIEVVSYREVTWPDACLGVTRHGTVCGQILVPGFLATLTADGRLYRYHGSGNSFVAASFARDATVGRPVGESVAIEGLAITGIEP